MYPPTLAEKDFIPAVLTQVTKQKPVQLIAKAHTVTATALMYEVGKGFVMVKPIESKEWWQELHPRHIKRINITLIVFAFGLVDLILGMFGAINLLPWLLDVIIVWGSISVFLTAVLMAKRYQ